MPLNDILEATENEIPESEFLALGTPKNVSAIRCKCGNLVYLRLPCLCSNCKDPKAYWRMLDGKTIPLANMDLGHLTNTVKMLAEKAGDYPSGEFRNAIEIAMDLFYAEIGSRDKEIAQASGIMNALKRSITGKAPNDDQ